MTPPRAAPPAGATVRAAAQRDEPPYAMHRRYGWLLRRGLAWLFDEIDYPPQAVASLGQLAERGTIVYVARGASVWLALCFNHVLQAAGLPLADAVGGVNFSWLQPVARLWRAFVRRHEPVAAPLVTPPGRAPLTRREALFAAAALGGQTAYVALPMPREGRTRHADLNDYIRAFIAAQRLQARPIFLAPHALIDRGQSGVASPTLLDRIFGDPRRPGDLRHVAMLLSLRRGRLRMADPLDLGAFIAAHPGLDDVLLARKVRHELHRRINEEERVVAGPPQAGYETTARRVLRDPLVRQAVADASARTGRGDLLLEAQAAEALRSITARYDVRVVRLAAQVLRFVFNRIYDGIAVDEAGLAATLEAARRGPLIFCPSHRSHVDYLVLSSVLWEHRVAPPHIAAGANLAFFPLGRLFRGCGAFFLRRSFRDDALYAAVLRAYLVDLLRRGTSLEFFVEGGRSRTGKLLMPRFGLLGMCVDAWRQGAREDLQFVPVSIDYERIIEARSYQRELRGADKKAEDIGGLLRTPGVLRSRYGRLQLQFAAPISLATVAAARGLPQSADAEWDGAWRAEVQRLGYRILHSVAMVCSVTPTAVVATALLGHAGRGMAQGVLLARARHIVAFLDGAAARISAPLTREDTQVSAVLEAVHRMVDDKSVVLDRAGRGDTEPIYRVPDESRIALDYQKNGLMNHFAPAALVARALRRRGGARCAYAVLRADTEFLSRLFKREFLFRVDSDLDTYFETTLAGLAARGLVAIDGRAPVEVVDPEGIALLAGLLDSLVQAYWVTARTLLDLRAFPLWRRECVHRTLERTRRAFLEGEITRPEAANQSVVETALAWSLDAGLVSVRTAGKRQTLQLAADLSPTRLQEMIDAIHAFL